MWFIWCAWNKPFHKQKIIMFPECPANQKQSNASMPNPEAEICVCLLFFSPRSRVFLALAHGDTSVVTALYISSRAHPPARDVSFDTSLRQAIRTCHSEEGKDWGGKKGVKTNSAEKSIWLKEWDNERISDNSWQTSTSRVRDLIRNRQERKKTAFKNSHLSLEWILDTKCPSHLDTVIYISFSDIIFFLWPETQFLKKATRDWKWSFNGIAWKDISCLRDPRICNWFNMTESSPSARPHQSVELWPDLCLILQ